MATGRGAGGKKQELTGQAAFVERIRAKQRTNPVNKRCADCTERGPTYVCITFQTFVCQTCGGIHREFGHKIKSISLSEWTEAEVKAVEAGGNEVSNASYLAKWTAEKCPEPDGGDMEKIREFLKQKYEDKQWWKEVPREHAAAAAAAAQAAASNGAQATGGQAAAAAHGAVEAIGKPKAASSSAAQAANAYAAAASATSAASVADLLTGDSADVTPTATPAAAAPVAAAGAAATAAPTPVAAASTPPAASQAAPVGGSLLDVDFSSVVSPVQVTSISPQNGATGNSMGLADDLFASQVPTSTTSPGGAAGGSSANAMGLADDLFAASTPATTADPHAAVAAAQEAMRPDGDRLKQALLSDPTAAMSEINRLFQQQSAEAEEKRKQRQDAYASLGSFGGGGGYASGFPGVAAPQMQAASPFGGLPMMPPAASPPQAAVSSGALPTMLQANPNMANTMNMTPQQLASMRPEELMQMQALIQQALQAKPRCRQCGAEIAPTAKFCSECGAPNPAAMGGAMPAGVPAVGRQPAPLASTWTPPALGSQAGQGTGSPARLESPTGAAQPKQFDDLMEAFGNLTLK
eukprot:TRINITY_DN33298_c0_g1_i1.p1 TRINITY_DN33298_c0_g1~~TRINITY_DN33298_c0_g1_i1.p1  ORF type:complete len:580 (-),score=153.95 TRINITY_DN33298_c0_g1_i1:63-1802(-)